MKINSVQLQNHVEFNFFSDDSTLQGGPKKWATTNLKKIVLKVANEITFLLKVKVWIKHYNTLRW